MHTNKTNISSHKVTERRSQCWTRRRAGGRVCQSTFQGSSARFPLHLWSWLIQFCSLHSITTSSLLLWPGARFSVHSTQGVPLISCRGSTRDTSVSWHCKTHSPWCQAMWTYKGMYSLWCLFLTAEHCSVHTHDLLGEALC